MKNQTSPLAPRRQRDYAGVLSSILAILAGLLVGLPLFCWRRIPRMHSRPSVRSSRAASTAA